MESDIRLMQEATSAALKEMKIDVQHGQEIQKKALAMTCEMLHDRLLRIEDWIYEQSDA